MTAVQDENHDAANSTYAYDDAGHLTTATQVLSANPFTTTAASYGYDRHGNLKQVTDPNGNITQFVYDDFGQLLVESTPVSGVTTWQYDVAGQPTVETRANETVTTRSFDALGRVVSAVSVGAAEEIVLWQYDDGPLGKGRLSTMINPTGSTTYRWDRRGFLLHETKAVGLSALYATSFEYDPDGNRDRLIYPTGRSLRTTFDWAGRPITATLNGSPIVTSAAYLPFGPRSEIAFGNGTTRTTAYDQRYRPVANGLSGPGGVIASYSYSYDPAGNVTAIRDLLDSAYDREFQYDGVGRLLGADTGSALWGNGSFSYDEMGNMLSVSLGSIARSFSYEGTTSKLASASENGVVRSVVYDASGNETGLGSKSYSWSSRNYRESDGVMSFGYDGRGIRTVTKTAAVTTEGHFLYPPELTLMSEFDIDGSSSTPKAEYVTFAGEPIAVVEGPGSALRWNLNDHLGAVVLQTDAAAQVVWRVEREPYGKEYARRAGVGVHQPLALPGQEEGAGEESYNIFRWYRPGMGRFLSVDPTWQSADIGRPQSWNRYSYVLNNPVNLTDPDGRMWDWRGFSFAQIEENLKNATVGAAATVIADYVIPDGDTPLFEAGYGTGTNPNLGSVAVSGAVLTAYQVGPVDELRAVSVPGDNLDIHHAPQAHPSGQVIPNYDPATAPGMAVPKPEHQNIPTQKGSHTGSPRDLVAKDMRDLRNHTKRRTQLSRSL